MFKEFKSGSLQLLAEALAKQLQELKGTVLHPFSPVWIVVQNKEMKQWLTLQIALQNGIAANLEFLLPSELVWKLYRLNHSDVPDMLPSDRQPMQLMLFKILRENKESVFSNTDGFIFEDEKQAFRFTGQIADVFDLYQVYRPALLDSWEKGDLTTQDSSEQWQAKLWQRLGESWSGSGIPVRSKTFSRLLAELQDGSFPVEKIPDQLFVFGLSLFSKPFARLISGIGEIKDVFFFQQSWAGIKPRGETGSDWNLLFEAWNKPKSESGKLITELASPSMKLLIPASETNSGSLLHLVQTSLMGEKSAEIPVSIETDLSFSIHACHNPRREVEVLKQNLLTVMDTNPEIKPQDILVMVPDMEIYGELVQTSFQFSENEPFLPVSLVYNDNDSSVQGFAQFIKLLSGVFKADEVLDFISQTAIQKSLGLTDDDISMVKIWVSENKIYWGLSPLNDEYARQSWEKGIKNLIGGFSIETDDFQIFEESIPYKGISTGDHVTLAAILSRLIHFFEACLDELKAPKMATEWLSIFEAWAIWLFPENTRGEGVAPVLFSVLAKLKQASEVSGNSVKMEYALVKEWVLSVLEQKNAVSGRIGHGVVLSSYIPYRGIPFKFIAALGMNEDSFPRKAIRPDFDLIAKYPQPGDRILTEDDSLFFLETLLSAQEYLHISYIGQSQHTEDKKLPSVLIEQLSECISSKIPVKTYWFRHTLHGFSPKNFGHPKLRNYSGKHAVLANKIRQPQTTGKRFLNDDIDYVQPETDSVIYLSDLITFFCHPSKYFSINELGLRIPFENEEIESREPFKLSGLRRYELNHILFEGIRFGAGESILKKYSETAGLLPPAFTGEKVFLQEEREVHALFDALKSKNSASSVQADVSLHCGEFIIEGSVNDIYNSDRIVTRLGSIKATDLIKLWITHLALKVSKPEFISSILLYKDAKSGVQEVSLEEVAEPEEHLTSLVEWFLEAGKSKSALNFFPETSKVYAHAIMGKTEPEVALRKAAQKWSGSKFEYNIESKDYYNALVWRGSYPLEATYFAENASEFWLPLLTNIKQSK